MSAGNIFAQVENAPTGSQGSSVVSVGIENATTTSQIEDVFNISFSLTNLKGMQAGVKYGVQLVKEEGGRSLLVDEVVYSETFILKEYSRTGHLVSYTPPQGLSGEYSLYVVSKNDAGFLFASAFVEKIKLKMTSSAFASLDGKCYLSVGDQPQKYMFSDTVIVEPKDQVVVHCPTVKNQSGKVIRPTPALYSGSFYGEAVPFDLHSESVAIKNEEYNLNLPNSLKSGEYFGNVEFLGDGIVLRSAPFHYVVRGLSVVIENIWLDKDFYTKGEMATSSFLWKGTVEDLAHAQNTREALLGATFEAQITDIEGRSCGDMITRPLEVSVIRPEAVFSITRDCYSPTVTVQIKGSKGSLLAQKSITLPTPAPKSSQKVIIIILILLLSVGLGVFFGMSYKNKLKAPGAVLLALFFAGMGLAMPSRDVSAATFTYGPSSIGCTINVNLNKSQYTPGETITITASSSDCPRGSGATSYSTGAPSLTLSVTDSTGAALAAGNFGLGNAQSLVLGSTPKTVTFKAPSTTSIDGGKFRVNLSSQWSYCVNTQSSTLPPGCNTHGPDTGTIPFISSTALAVVTVAANPDWVASGKTSNITWKAGSFFDSCRIVGEEGMQTFGLYADPKYFFEEIKNVGLEGTVSTKELNQTTTYFVECSKVGYVPVLGSTFVHVPRASVELNHALYYNQPKPYLYDKRDFTFDLVTEDITNANIPGHYSSYLPSPTVCYMAKMIAPSSEWGAWGVYPCMNPRGFYRAKLSPEEFGFKPGRNGVRVYMTVNGIDTLPAESFIDIPDFPPKETGKFSVDVGSVPAAWDISSSEGMITGIKALKDSGYVDYTGELWNLAYSTSSSLIVTDSGVGGVMDTAGDSNTRFILKSDGTLWVSGSNTNGVYGNGTNVSSAAPVRVDGFEGRKILQVVGNSRTVHVLTEDGDVYGWGKNNYGQIGDGTLVDKLTPTLIAAPGYLGDRGKFNYIAAGSSTTYGVVPRYTAFYLPSLTPFIHFNGEAYAWGNGSSGQLGNNKSGSGVFSAAPVAVAASTSDKGYMIFAEGSYAFLFDTYSSILPWGDNTYGQLGASGTATSYIKPTTSLFTNYTYSGGRPSEYWTGKPQEIWKKFLLTPSSVYLLTRQGALWGSGINPGDGTPVKRSPVAVVDSTGSVLKSIDDVGKISNAGVVTILKSDGTLYSLGGGRTTAQEIFEKLATPITVSGQGSLSATDDVRPGKYTITWKDVDGYITPAPETYILKSGETHIFTGAYTLKPTPPGPSTTIIGTCGPATTSGVSFPVAPSDAAKCSSGTPADRTPAISGWWSWNCLGSDNATTLDDDLTCKAPIGGGDGCIVGNVCSVTVTNGSCSMVNDVCISGNFVSKADTPTFYEWACNGINGGTNDQCSIPKQVDGLCGGANSSCTQGTLFDALDTTTDYKWSCNGVGGGVDVQCSLPIVPTNPSVCLKDGICRGSETLLNCPSDCKPKVKQI